VVGSPGEQAPHGPARVERETVPPPVPPHAHAVERRGARRAPPGAFHYVDGVAATREPAEDLVQVDLRAAGVRILTVVPIHEQDLHSAPDSRAALSSTPFTNAGAFAPANQWASFTASSITTRGGVSPSSSSASASRRMLRSTTPTRSRRQCSAAAPTRVSNSGSPATAFAARSAPRSNPAGGRPKLVASRATTVSIEGCRDRSEGWRSGSARARALVSGRCTDELGQDVGRGE